MPPGTERPQGRPGTAIEAQQAKGTTAPKIAVEAHRDGTQAGVGELSSEHRRTHRIDVTTTRRVAVVSLIGRSLGVGISAGRVRFACGPHPGLDDRSASVYGHPEQTSRVRLAVRSGDPRGDSSTRPRPHPRSPEPSAQLDPLRSPSARIRLDGQHDTVLEFSVVPGHSHPGGRGSSDTIARRRRGTQA